MGKNSWGWGRLPFCWPLPEVGRKSRSWRHCCFWHFNANKFTYALTLTNHLPRLFELNRLGHDDSGFLLLNPLAYLFFSGTVTRLSMRCCVRSAVVGTPVCRSLLLLPRFQSDGHHSSDHNRIPIHDLLRFDRRLLPGAVRSFLYAGCSLAR